MKHFLICAAVLLNAIPAPGQAREAEALVGLWESPDLQIVLKIDRLGEHFQGRIAWVSETGGVPLDSKNPDPNLRVMPLKGRKILEGLRYDASAGMWSGGTFYNYRDGKTYNCKLLLIDQNRLQFEEMSAGAASKSVWLRKQ